jgi:hypothetical protein
VTFFRIGAAAEDAAIGVVACPEFGADDEVPIRIPADEVARCLVRIPVGDDGAVLGPPVRIADPREIVQPARAVDQRDPAAIRGFPAQPAILAARAMETSAFFMAILLFEDWFSMSHDG